MARPPDPASESTLQSLTEQLKEQNFKLTQIRNIGEAQVEAAEDAAAVAREAAREAARAAGDDEEGPEIAIKVETEEAPGLFKKLKLGGLAMSFLGSAMTGLTSAFTWLGNAFGPKLLLKLKAIAPWAMILTGLTMAIEDGITGWMDSESWGTSKVSGFLGGFFGGAGDGGIKNAFANAGKWALIGAGVGSIVPVVGTLVGGLVGAAIGGILGFIGGKKLAKGFDGIGAWFYKQFSDLVLGPIKAVWDFIAPDWAKSVTDKMEWSDLLPPGLTKLFNGEYFKFDFPKFEWYDIFPKFLVDLFKAGMKGVKEADFKWTDLMPKFLVKFFSGEYDKEGSFEWSDLLPEFITKIIGVAKTAWADTPFTWKSLVPNFILKIIDGFTQTGEFSWMDLVPKFISDLVSAGADEATKGGEFSWKALLPDWMIGAWDSTKGLAKQVGAFDWRAILPKFIADLFPGDKPLTIAAGLSAISGFDWRALLPDFISDLFPGDKPLTIAAGLEAIGSWNWKSLLPKFIQDFFDDPTKLAKEIGDKGFDWKDLLPEFIRSFFTDKKIDKAAETVGLAMDWWKSLLPDFIVNIMEGKSPFADRDEAADLKKTQKAKDELEESMGDLTGGGIGDMFNLGTLMAPIREKVSTLLDPETAPWGLGKFSGFMRDKLLAMLPSPEGLAEGGLVGLSKMGPQSMGAAMGLESGGLFTLSQGEFVLDNQAAQSFLQAAMILKGQDLSGPKLADLQRESIATMTTGGGSNVVVSAPTTTQISSSSAMALPVMPIQPSNGETSLNG